MAFKEAEKDSIKSRFKSLARTAGAVTLGLSLCVGSGALLGSSKDTGIEITKVNAICAAQNAILVSTPSPGTISNSALAKDKKAMLSLQRMYDPQTGLFNGAQWWQQPVILQTVMNYSMLSHNEKYLTDICKTFMLNKSGNFITGQNDDEGWWAIAWIEAYQITKKPQYLWTAKILFDNIAKSWTNECRGGVLWNSSGTYKNSITNAQFMYIAASLYGKTGDKKYLDWALKEYDWFMASGMLDHGNLVLDGLTSSCRAAGGTWTYNQGVTIGALTELTRVTGNKMYIDKAQKIADYIDKHSVNKKGILDEIGCRYAHPCDIGSSNSNGAAAHNNFILNSAQFKGIYMMNLYFLYQTDHNPAYANFIQKNAAAIWFRDRTSQNIFGFDWNGPRSYSSATQASTQSSAISVLNATIPKS